MAHGCIKLVVVDKAYCLKLPFLNVGQRSYPDNLAVGFIRGSHMRVGFIGLGRMGMPMAKNVLKAGFELRVHNRSRGKVDEMVALGAEAATSPGEVTQASDIVLTCLPDIPTVEQVFLGENGVVTSARQGQILVDHSTIGPSTARKIAAAADEKGASFLDAPITGGSIDVAAAATLNILVGGDKDAYQQALPVLRAMGKKSPISVRQARVVL